MEKNAVETIKCPCRRKSCVRHGKCAECVEYHRGHSKYPYPSCQKPKKAVPATRGRTEEQ